MNGVAWMVLDLHSKDEVEAIADATARHGGVWTAESAPDTRANDYQKLYKDGGTHWPARWIVRRVDE